MGTIRAGEGKGLGRKRIAGAVLAVMVVAGAGAAGGVLAWRAVKGRPAAYKVTLSAASATSTNWWVPGEEECPAGRGEGPPRRDTTANPQGVSPAEPVGAGQVLVYRLLVQAGDKAPDTGDLTASLVFRQRADDPGFDGAGLLCAFVEAGNPLTTSAAATASASATAAATEAGAPGGGDLHSDVLVRGLERGSTALVELWVRASDNIGRGTDALVARLTRVTAPAGTTADVVAGSARILRASKPSRTEVQVELTEGPGSGAKGGALTAGGPITYTMVLRNAATQEVANQVVVKFEADPAVTVETIEVRDDAGRVTSCERGSTAVTCRAPYLVPGEEVTVVLRGRVSPGAPTLFAGSGANCAKQAQDLCAHASVVAVAGVTGALARADLATDVPATQALGLSKVAADGSAALYAGRYADFSYVLVSSAAAPVSEVRLDDPSCNAPTLASGDDGADGVLSPGERWTYRCSAVVKRSGAEVTMTGKGPAGEQVGVVARLATPVLDPALALRARAETGGPAVVELVNEGDAALTAVVVEGRDCDLASASGDVDRNGSLDPGERWAVGCQQRTGPVRAYATDPAGGAVTAAIDE